MLTEEAAKFSESFITSIVIGIDIVPRMSMTNLLALRANVLQAVQASSKPKYAILSVC